MQTHPARSVSRRLLATVAILCAAIALAAQNASAADSGAFATTNPATSSHKWKKRWIASWVALAALNTLDIHSSRGHGEANPLFRNSSGRFAPGKAAMFKLAIGGGFLGAQLLAMRSNPEKDFYKPFTVANTVALGGLGGVVAHNYSLPPPKPQPRPAP